MNTYEFSQDPNHKLPFLIIIIGLLIALLLLSISCTKEPKYVYECKVEIIDTNWEKDTIRIRSLSNKDPKFYLLDNVLYLRTTYDEKLYDNIMVYRELSIITDSIKYYR